MKRNLKVTFFAVAITVLLLIALTMNSVSAESEVEVNLDPTDAAEVTLNLQDMDEVYLYPTDAAEVTLNLQDMDEVYLYPTDAAEVELNPSEPMTFPTERGLNELIYDDGTAETANAWVSAGNGRAVRFTPLSYPVDILTARICFMPDWPSSNHEEFAVYVYDDDGPSGEPGTCLGGPIDHTATAWGWCDVDISGLGITIESGDFYILYEQLTDFPDCEGLCGDQSLPQYGRSWKYYDGNWNLEDDRNYMIRCVVDDHAIDEWTYMVYLDGDNNLEGAAIDDFLEMSSVGSSPTVNIVVQFDRIPDYDSSYGDWTDCKRFYVTFGMTPTAENAISDLGECNMGDPNTLDEFVTWAMTEYPANKYALILWNHGSGWKKWKWNDPDPDIGRGVCWDDTSGGDYLTLRETEQALTGKYVDLLGYDACFMHMMAVVYQVMDNTGVSVGSEEVEPNDGWPYDTILADLTASPTTDNYHFGPAIVDSYMDSYGYAGSETLSSMPKLYLPHIVTAVDNLAQALITEINGGNWAQIEEARNAAAEMMHDSDYIDLHHFAEMVATYVPGAQREALTVMNEVFWCIYEKHGTSVPNDHGLSIYYPRYGGSYLASYGGTAFARDTQWNELLVKYLYYPDGAGLDDIAVFSAPLWFVDTNGDHLADDVFGYGFAGATPLVGDFNQDGADDIAVFCAPLWFVDTNGDHIADDVFGYGFAGATPLVGDINQDGTDDIAVFCDGAWFVDTNGDHIADDVFGYGFAGATPLVGDINQDGTDDIAVFCDGLWFVDTNGDHIADDVFGYGFAGATPLVGDINQDGTDDIAVFSAPLWFVDTNGDHLADDVFGYGFAGATPLVGNFG